MIPREKGSSLPTRCEEDCLLPAGHDGDHLQESEQRRELAAAEIARELGT